MTFKSKKRAAPAVAAAPAEAEQSSDDEPAVILNRKRPWHVIRQVAAALAPVTPCAPVPASNAVTGAVTGPQQPPAYTAKQIALLRKLSSALNIAPQLTSVLFASEVTDTSAAVKIETVEPETAASAVTESNGTEHASTEAAAVGAAAGSSSGSSSSSSDASNKRKADEISTSTDSNISSNSSSSSSSKAILSNGDLIQVAKLLRKQLPSISLSD
eukprot:3307-Heterococcus_DN1.PRE.2